MMAETNENNRGQCINDRDMNNCKATNDNEHSSIGNSWAELVYPLLELNDSATDSDSKYSYLTCNSSETISNSVFIDDSVSISNSETTSVSIGLSDTGSELPPLYDSWDGDASKLSSRSSSESLITAGNLNRRLAESVECLIQRDSNIMDVKLWKEMDYIAQVLRHNAFDLKKKKEIVAVIAQNRFHIVLCKILNIMTSDDLDSRSFKSQWKPLKKLLTLCWIISDTSKYFCEQLCSYENQSMPTVLVKLLKTVSACVNDLETKIIHRFVMKSLLGLIHNANRHVHEAKDIFHDLEIIPVLKSISKSTIAMIQVLLTYITRLGIYVYLQVSIKINNVLPTINKVSKILHFENVMLLYQFSRVIVNCRNEHENQYINSCFHYLCYRQSAIWCCLMWSKN